METLVLIIIIAWAVREGVQAGSRHWQGSKAANRQSTKGQGVGRRAASAARHDFGYWLHQVLAGFPQTRHGLGEAWHAGRKTQAEGYAARQRAKTDHLTTRARLLPEIREHRRRQAEALQQIRQARQPEAAQPSPGGTPAPQAPPQPTTTGEPMTTGVNVNDPQPYGPAAPANGFTSDPLNGSGILRPAGGGGSGGTRMSGDTTYHQQMTELTALRQDADDEVASVRRKRMLNRLDILTSLGLDSASLSEAAAIDDALREQQKAAQATLDAADAAIHGLQTRHGGIQEAVDNSQVPQPAQPEFYAS